MGAGQGLVANFAYTRGGRGQKKVGVPEIDLQFRGLLMISFFSWKIFLMWVGGWVSGSGGGTQAAIPPPTPPL